MLVELNYHVFIDLGGFVERHHHFYIGLVVGKVNDICCAQPRSELRLRETYDQALVLRKQLVVLEHNGLSLAGMQLGCWHTC